MVLCYWIVVVSYSFTCAYVFEDGLKVNVIHRLLVYAVDMLGGSIHTIKRKANALLATGRMVGLEVLRKLSVYSCH
jgi:hypothetical protein